MNLSRLRRTGGRYWATLDVGIGKIKSDYKIRDPEILRDFGTRSFISLGDSNHLAT